KRRPVYACCASYAGLGVRRSSESEGGSNPAFLCRGKAGLLRFARNDGGEACALIPAARFPLGFCHFVVPLSDRGRRESRAPAAPAAPCAMGSKERTRL